MVQAIERASRTADRPRWTGRTVQAVLLDLDGTLLDTADDITAVLNQALAEQHLGSLATSQVRNLIGRGVPTLIERAVALLGSSAPAADRKALLEQFCVYYGRRHVQKECTARVFPGVAEGLGELHALGLRLAVVTNKKRLFAEWLLERFGLSAWIDAVVGGDSCQYRKPDPQPLHFACRALHVDLSHALMVGDSVTDVLAARAAGVPIVCVPYGYNEGSDPRALPCDAFIEKLTELPAMLAKSVFEA